MREECVGMPHDVCVYVCVCTKHIYVGYGIGISNCNIYVLSF